MVLAKALDDICPTFQGETQEDKELRINERINFFAKSEVDLDKEWEELEKEAQTELEQFIKERNAIFSKIQKTNNSEKITQKIESFERKKEDRVNYLARKLDRDVEALKEKLKEVKKDSKKYTQINTKIQELKKTIEAKIKKTELRYNTIIKNTMNSDNAERVDQRLEQSKSVWERKYNELRDKHLVKETIHNNKRMEFDQIRIAMRGFAEEVEHFKHWCILSDISLKECYTEAVKRGKMIRRDTSKIETVLKQILAGDI